ncbi:MAG: trypsin-like peptidase domain-containing protein [Planctomycetes bacterium]|nr:trypsin-like peptidase domain-containing protein [Planctomycetota bacterium]
MTRQIQIMNALESLRGVTNNFSDHVSDVSEIIGSEIEILASRLSELRLHPPILRTKDFKHPKGDELPLPTAENDTTAVFERLIDEKDFLPVWFFEQGAQVQRSVARVVLTKPHAGFPPGTGWATGFMISPSLFLTNNHVIPNEAFAKKIRMQFNYQLGPDGGERETESFFPLSDNIFHTNAALDYTLIRLRPKLPAIGDGDPVVAGARWGFIPVNDNPVFREKQHFNIIQHPDGRHKEVALQNNEIDKLFQNTVLYKADTEPGSSGSPVFNNLWQLVALHHAGGERDEDGKWLSNEGIRIDRIVEDLRQHFADASNEGVLVELGI